MLYWSHLNLLALKQKQPKTVCNVSIQLEDNGHLICKFNHADESFLGLRLFTQVLNRRRVQN